MKLNENKAGVLVGSLYGLWHALWLVLVATGVAKPLLDWILSLHFITVDYSIEPFQIGRALFLIVITTSCGFMLGWVLAKGWNILSGEA